MNGVDEWGPVFQQVIVRALCDALGFTNLPHTKEEHRSTVNQARAWFIENTDDFQLICDLADVGSDSVRETALMLIHARSSGDHSRVPLFWKHVFRGKRGPNLTNIERAVAKVAEDA